MSLKHIGDDLYEETIGGDFEDFYQGMEIKHFPGRTLTESDNTWLTLLLMNQHPLHFDQNYAKNTEFGKVLINSSLTLALVGGMTVHALSARCSANLGWDRVRLHHPLYVGDTVYAHSKILECRPSKSRPKEGIIRVETKGINQNAQCVISFERCFMVKRRMTSPC